MTWNQLTREERRQRLMKYGKYDHVLAMDDKYPKAEMFGPACASADWGPGWTKLVEPCLEVLVRHGCSVAQIKQKFCRLTVYWNGPAWTADARRVWSESGEEGPDPMDLFKEVDMVIRLMSHRSLFTCEKCGEQPSRENVGTDKSGTRLCDRCLVEERK